MTAQIIEAKPVEANLGRVRARLNDRIARAARFPITLIVAPAGFGKTVALQDFIESARLDVVRYDVRREDRTLLAFVRGMTEALAQTAPTAIAAFPAIQQTAMASRAPASDLASWFDEHLKRTVCTIVIDDLQNSAGDPSAMAFLADLIDRTNDHIKWVIATRCDVGLRVATWLGYQKMDVPIDENDLRFTIEEALAAADLAQAGVDTDEVSALHQLTDGWPVALAIALRTRTQAADLRSATTGTREMVYRFLAEQAFTGLSETERRFLLDTCIFSAFDMEIAEAFGGNAEFIADLRRKVAFLSATSPSELRYYNLFRDFLETELQRLGDREWKRALAAGALALESRGDDAGALAMLTRAGDHSGMLDIIDRTGFGLIECGEAAVVSAAIERLPERARCENATILGIRAILEGNHGNPDVAEWLFISAINAANNHDLRILLTYRYALELVRNERDCRELLMPYAQTEDVPIGLHASILGTLATSHVRAGDFDEAALAIDRALSLLEPATDDAIRARLYQQAAYVYQFAPSRERAQIYAERAVGLALSCSLYDVAARAYSILYTLAYDKFDDPIAILSILDKLRECARKSASRQAEVFGLIATYEIEAERGNEAALEELDRQITASRVMLKGARAEALLPAEALRASWTGEFKRAYELIADTLEHQTEHDRRAYRAAEIAVYAIAAGLHSEGDRAIQQAVDALDRCDAPSRRTIRTRLRLSSAELLRGRSVAAHRHLSEAERTLTPEMRRLRTLVECARTLYRVHLGRADEAVLTGSLERLRSEHLGGLARLIEALPFLEIKGHGYALLTAAERNVLDLIVQGASTKEVATHTGRRPQTVDTHVRSICRKLHCSGRREAVALAMSSGWVQP